MKRVRGSVDVCALHDVGDCVQAEGAACPFETTISKRWDRAGRDVNLWWGFFMPAGLRNVYGGFCHRKTRSRSSSAIRLFSGSATVGGRTGLHAGNHVDQCVAADAALPLLLGPHPPDLDCSACSGEVLGVHPDSPASLIRALTMVHLDPASPVAPDRLDLRPCQSNSKKQRSKTA